jgi:hypothetical protein
LLLFLSKVFGQSLWDSGKKKKIKKIRSVLQVKAVFRGAASLKAKTRKNIETII